MKKRVLAAMSGGVDSSVAAALLVQQGYEVIGVTMQIWPDLPEDAILKADHTGCCSLYAVEDARRVAEILEIPYYVLNLKDAFEHHVIDYFAAEYAHGRTPNPCIACNRYIKFDVLMERAAALECDYVATGHYARVAQEGGRYHLLKAVDESKDQSYVLYNLTQERLAKVLWPVGGLTKPAVRRIAAGLGLVNVAAKPDSQEICFVHSGTYADLVVERQGAAPGPILSTSGERLGTHKGLPYYTVGQRKGLGITAPAPLYVVDIDPAQNAVIVGAAEEVMDEGLVAGDLNWIAWSEPPAAFRAAAKIRARSPEVPSAVSVRPGGRVAVTFDAPQRAVTPGQAVVFYAGERVLGGGVIERQP